MGVIYSIEAAAGKDGRHALPWFDYLSFVETEERRLDVSSFADDVWHFEDVAVSHPHGDLFQPLSMSCLAGRSGDPGLLIRTRHEQYIASASGAPWSAAIGVTEQVGDSLTLDPVPQDQLPLDAIAVCMPTAEAPRGTTESKSASWISHGQCMFGALASNGTAVAMWGKATGRDGARLLPIVGPQPWQSLAGALTPCNEVADLLGPLVEQGDEQDTWCVLLAGWDGTRIPVAAFRMWGSVASPELSSEVLPAFDLPIPRRKGSRSPAAAPPSKASAAWQAVAADAGRSGSASAIALHVETPQARVWVLSPDGDLQAWGVASPKSLGTWRPQWQQADSRNFHVIGMCGNQDDGSLHVVGRDPSAGLRWLRARVPSDLDS